MTPRFFWTLFCFIIYTIAGVAGCENIFSNLSSFLSILQPFSVACGIGLKVFWMWRTSKRVRRGPRKLVRAIIMPSFISNNLKARIPALRHEQGFSVKRICSILNVRKTLAYEILRHHHTHGVAFDLNARQRGVQHCALTSVDLAFI